MNKNKKFTYKNVVIVGVGFPDVLRVIDNINKKQSYRKINILGFLDDNKKFKKKIFWGYKILGGINWLKNKKNVFVINAVCSSTKLRAIVQKKINKYNKNSLSIIDPEIDCSHSEIQKGVIICGGTRIGHNVKIKTGVIISFNVNIGHDTKIDKNCFIASGANILGHCKIGEQSFVGSNASILPKVKIGKFCSISMCSSVVNNVKSKSIMIGNPARKL